MKSTDSMNPDKIIIHHSLTEDSGTVSWGAIRNYHIKTMGWADIGYHAGVELVYGQYEALFGRPWHIPGAHTRDYNHDSLGFCFVGNFDKTPPSDEALKAGANVLFLWMNLYGISLSRVYCHRDFNPLKSCPGTQFDMVRLKNFILRLEE